LGGGVFGFPSWSFGDGVEKQHGPGWHVGIIGCWSFPAVWPILHTVAGLDAGLFEKLPNKFTAFGSVIVEGLVRPFAGDQNAPSGNTQVLEFVSVSFAPAGSHGVAGAFGLDSVQKPYGQRGEHGGICSSACKRRTCSRWVSLACSPSPAAWLTDLAKYFVR
jgi:hypothetical protein